MDVNRVTQDGLSPLHLAVKMNKPAIVQLLVENARVNCNAIVPSECTPLLTAAINGYVEVLEVLLYCGGVNIFALDSRSRKDVMELARKACSKAATRDQSRFKACLDIIAKVLSLR